MNARLESTVLVLGDGNLGLARMRAAHASTIIENSEQVAILLGTQREKEVMRALFESRRLEEGTDFIVASDSRNTVENAKSAVDMVQELGKSNLLVVTHQYHETPVPGVHRVSRIFSAQFPDHTVQLELISGVYVRQRGIQTLSGLLDYLVVARAEGDGRTAEIAEYLHAKIGVAREQVRNFFDGRPNTS